jgi:hypothetical protein
LLQQGRWLPMQFWREKELELNRRLTLLLPQTLQVKVQHRQHRNL